MDEKEIINQRLKKLTDFFKKSYLWVLILIVVALILGIYIRSLPMQDHGGRPGLWDVTRNDWTLGPDLDPWLFERTAKIIYQHHGSLPRMDYFRYVPLGFDTHQETVLLPYMIYWTHSLVNALIGPHSMEFAGALFPVIMFALTILAFFLFVREMFYRISGRQKSNIIAIISTFFMIVIPVFLPRTVAGIPEKESAVFFFIFLTFYFFLKSFHEKNTKKIILFSSLAALSTAGAGLVSGLCAYIYAIMGLAGFLGFILDKFDSKRRISYTVWWVLAAILLSTIPGKYDLRTLTTSLRHVWAVLLLAVVWFDFLLWRTSLSKLKFIQKIKLPKNIISLFLAVVLLFIALLLVNPSLIAEKARAIQNILFNPVVGRWNITVAENKQPFFVEWVNSFGPFLKDVPLFFWLFIIGSVVFVKKMLKDLDKKESWLMTASYCFLLVGLIFTRYSSNSIFNGENFLSKSVYLISVAFFLFVLIKVYSNNYKRKSRVFERIDFAYIFGISLFLVMLFSARSAIRLVMMLGPIAPIFVAYLLVVVVDAWSKNKDETMKIVLLAFMLIVLFASIFSFWSFYKGIKAQSYNMVPSSYNIQWQYAMQWVRNETPKNAVFAHWWDYGYWLQSIGDRATVLDGGNAIVFWNYWMGRLVLTGDNQQDALDFLYSHNATHLLIDSSDIGKYGAFSSIGSNKTYDRYSWIPVAPEDPRQVKETANSTLHVYPIGAYIDEDINYKINNTKIFLPAKKAALMGIIIEEYQVNNSRKFKQPQGVFAYNNIRKEIPFRYLQYGDFFKDYKTGLPGAIKLIPRIDPTQRGIQLNPYGAIIYLSPRVLRGYLAQKYILDDPFHNFPNFELAHTESSQIVKSLRQQGVDVPEFIYFRGIQGPIKIWRIKYTGNEKVLKKYLDTDPSKYLDWKL